MALASTVRLGEDAILPRVPFESRPIRESLGVPGKKGALLLLRDASSLKLGRFSQSVKDNPDVGERLVAMRLNQLVREGLLEKTPGKEPRYRLAPSPTP